MTLKLYADMILFSYLYDYLPTYFINYQLYHFKAKRKQILKSATLKSKGQSRENHNYL